MSTRGVGFRHSSTTDDRLFPFSANVIRAIASRTLSPEDAAHLDSPAEVLRHLYYPKKRGIYMNNGSTHDVALVDRAADPAAPQLPRRLERCEELYKVCSPADVRYDFGYMDILPCGVIRDGSYVSEVTLRKPCYEVLRFDYTKTHAESLALAPSLLNIQEGSAREFLSRFSIQRIKWLGCLQLEKPRFSDEFCCRTTPRSEFPPEPGSPRREKALEDHRNQLPICARNESVFTMISNLDVRRLAAPTRPPIDPAAASSSKCSSTLTSIDPAAASTSAPSSTSASGSKHTFSGNGNEHGNDDDVDPDDDRFYIHYFSYNSILRHLRGDVIRLYREAGLRVTHDDIVKAKVAELEIGFLATDSGLEISVDSAKRKQLLSTPHPFLSGSRLFRDEHRRLVDDSRIKGPPLPSPSQLFNFAEFDTTMQREGTWDDEILRNESSLPISHPGKDA